jgi:hypothetical protein
VEGCLAKQLRERRQVEAEELWKGSSIPISFRKDICEIIRREKYWPNDYYVPSDQMLYLLTTHWDDLENNLIYLEMEKRYGIQDDNVWMGIENQTLEEFLHLIDASRTHDGGESSDPDKPDSFWTFSEFQDQGPF